MELMSFYEMIEQHPELIGESISSGNHPTVVVRHTPSGLATCLPVDAITKADWSIISEVLTCRREPSVLQHMTRVVGYFSRVDNWNKSKIGELKDRQHGNYALPIAG
jgi:hypothetical protein